MLLMPRKASPSKIVRLSETIRPPTLRISAQYTPIAMVKLEQDQDSRIDATQADADVLLLATKAW